MDGRFRQFQPPPAGGAGGLRVDGGDRVPGPAIVTEMDTTLLILPQHHGDVSPDGSILIYPDNHKKAEA